MLFAITDIETTGSYASGNCITEICVCLFDGEKVVDTWHSLIQPEGSIPRYITQLTGITDDMVCDAPRFEDVAVEIEAFIGDAIFVAHNVNFDYSFMKKHFEEAGIVWNKNKLCTVRLAKKAYPGHASYSLGNICVHFGIGNDARHRAKGDTLATVELFQKIIDVLGIDELIDMSKRGSGEAFLPNNLDSQVFHDLPENAGVYYFQDSKGKIIYIGKALNIKKRIRNHFSGKLKSERRQAYFTEIYNITYQLTGTELIALIMEDMEIKKHWPKYNKAQKTAIGKFGVYTYEDQARAIRLCVKKVTNSALPIRSFTSTERARQWLFEFADENQIHYKYCGLPVIDLPQGSVATHNEQITEAIRKQSNVDGSFLIKGIGRNVDENSFVWVYDGRLKGIGYVPAEVGISESSALEDYLTPIVHSSVIESILKSHIEKCSPRDIVVLKEDGSKGN
ncbi:MAG: DNA polymerase-3 subunit epsilon [Flavobacteriales bacterium]